MFYYKISELNLDFLENGIKEGHCSNCSPESPLLNSPDSPELLKVVLLGAPGVGKTSIIQVIYILLYIYPNYT